MILFFDTETTGLPKNWRSPVTNLNDWPRLVQLAYILHDNEGRLIKKASSFVKPTNFEIPEASTKIHGITTEQALREGRELKDVLDEFILVSNEADYLVAHNVKFDSNVIGAELLRNNMQNLIPLKNTFCTMEDSTTFCAIEGNSGYKWPSLSELYHKLFNSTFTEAHNAEIDILITCKCFWELKRRGIINFSNAKEIPVDKSFTFFEDFISKEGEQYIEEYCLQNNLNQVPSAAISEAIMFLQSNFRKVSKNEGLEDEISILKNIFLYTETIIPESTLNKTQANFLLLIKKEIIEEYESLSIFNNETNKSIEDKILQFEVIGIIVSNHAKEFRDLVIHIYYYYLNRYYEFVISSKNIILLEKIDSNYSNYTNLAKDAHKRILQFVKDYDGSITQTINANVPQTIFELINNVKGELLIIKSEQGISSKIYDDLASNFVKKVTNVLVNWTVSNIKILNIRIESMQLGKTLLEVSEQVFKEIETIETDSDTREWFNEAKIFFNKLQEKLQPKSGCYIATMAYGDYNHPQVFKLREFRDTFLIKYYLGKLFINFYYWISPKIVKRCKHNQIVLNGSKWILDFSIKYILSK